MDVLRPVVALRARDGVVRLPKRAEDRFVLKSNTPLEGTNDRRGMVVGFPVERRHTQCGCVNILRRENAYGLGLGRSPKGLFVRVTNASRMGGGVRCGGGRGVLARVGVDPTDPRAASSSMGVLFHHSHPSLASRRQRPCSKQKRVFVSRASLARSRSQLASCELVSRPALRRRADARPKRCHLLLGAVLVSIQLHTPRSRRIIPCEAGGGVQRLSLHDGTQHTGTDTRS